MQVITTLHEQRCFRLQDSGLREKHEDLQKVSSLLDELSSIWTLPSVSCTASGWFASVYIGLFSHAFPISSFFFIILLVFAYVVFSGFLPTFNIIIIFLSSSPFPTGFVQ